MSSEDYTFYDMSSDELVLIINEHDPESTHISADPGVMSTAERERIRIKNDKLLKQREHQYIFEMNKMSQLCSHVREGRKCKPSKPSKTGKKSKKCTFAHNSLELKPNQCGHVTCYNTRRVKIRGVLTYVNTYGKKMCHHIHEGEKRREFYNRIGIRETLYELSTHAINRRKDKYQHLWVPKEYLVQIMLDLSECGLLEGSLIETY